LHALHPNQTDGQPKKTTTKVQFIPISKKQLNKQRKKQNKIKQNKNRKKRKLGNKKNMSLTQ